LLPALGKCTVSRFGYWLCSGSVRNPNENIRRFAGALATESKAKLVICTVEYRTVYQMSRLRGAGQAVILDCSLTLSEEESGSILETVAV
jgi:hypothetical protein